MQISRKILIMSVFSVLSVVSFGFADDSDCGLFAIQNYANTGSEKNGFNVVKSYRGTQENRYSNFLTIPEQIDENEGIIDMESLNKAILNLKKYCCENNLGGLQSDYIQCKTDHNHFEPNSLDSPYLFDHLFDVIMRRFSGLSGDIYSGITIDKKGGERRTFIKQKIESLSGSDPQSIIDEYKKMRSLTPDYDIAQKVDEKFKLDTTNSFLNYVSGQGGSQESKDVSIALKNYKNWTLYDRYHNACALSEYFYLLLGQNWTLKDKLKVVSSISKCNDVVSQHIADETSYTKLAIQISANRFQQNYLEGYLSYMNTRAQKLKTTRKNATDRFMDVVRAVPALIRNSTK